MKNRFRTPILFYGEISERLSPIFSTIHHRHPTKQAVAANDRPNHSIHIRTVPFISGGTARIMKSIPPRNRAYGQ